MPSGGVTGLPRNLSLTAPGERTKIADRIEGTWDDLTTTALAGSATFTGATVGTFVNAANANLTATGDGIGRSMGRGVGAFADQAGTLRYQGDVVNNGTFNNLVDVSVVANALVRDTEGQFGLGAGRVQYINGAIAQGAFRFAAQSVTQNVQAG